MRFLLPLIAALKQSAAPKRAGTGQEVAAAYMACKEELRRWGLKKETGQIGCQALGVVKAGGVLHKYFQRDAQSARSSSSIRVKGD